jgi:hypothetical protein
MTVTPVRAENGILIAQVRAHTRRDGLLSNIGVACPVDESALMLFRQTLLHHPDNDQGSVELKGG